MAHASSVVSSLAYIAPIIHDHAMNFVQQISANLMLPTLRLMVRLTGQDRMIRQMAKNMNAIETKRRAFKGYTAQSSDVFIATTSKSGTNWAMQIAHQIAHYGAGEFDNIYDVVAWPEPPPPMSSIALTDQSIAERSPTGLRVIKTHLEAEFVPYSPAAKYIVVLRDPKEVFVSGYYFGHEIIEPAGMRFTVEQWLDLFCSDGCIFGSWAAHTAGWWAKRDLDNVLLLNYGGMKRDSEPAIRQIAALMGVELSEKQFANVMERSGFAYMRANKDKFSPMLPGGIRPTTVRSGKTGKSAELLTPAQMERIEKWVSAELQHLNSNFPIDTYFTV